MKASTIRRLADKLSESPILRAESVPTVEEIEAASRELSAPFPPDYRSFLEAFGAAMVGPYPIYGLRPVEVMGDDSWSVVEMTNRFRGESVGMAGNWVIISCDHSGNPVGLDLEGRVWIHDHDFGGAALIADCFEEYLRTQCLGMPPE